MKAHFFIPVQDFEIVEKLLKKYNIEYSAFIGMQKASIDGEGTVDKFMNFFAEEYFLTLRTTEYE